MKLFPGKIMIISDLNHIESVESSQVIGGGCCRNNYGYGKPKNVAVAIAVAGDRKGYGDYDY
ncbi:hypothetical protein AMR41_01320 [Hapalosiphon sp. MRB220]|nr:hypothetical protein AMR41_01320 [Hapalosiphon sp. MRB220]